MTAVSNDDLFLPKILNSSIEQSKDTNIDLNLNNEKDSLDIKQTSIKERNYNNKNTKLTNSSIKNSPIKKRESKSSINLLINTNILNNNEQQKIIEKYKVIISDLETKLTQIDSYHMKEISKLKEEIDTKDKNLKSLSKVNKNLKISLNNLTKRLDELIFKFTKDQKKLIHKNNLSSDKQKNFEEQLLLKERELKNQQNMINILSKDNKKLRHNLDIKNTFELNRDLSDKLYIKDQEIINLKKIIKDYEHKYKKHDECQKEIDMLREKLLNNQKELSEKKKEIFISHKNITQLQSKFVSSESAINLINKNIKERNKKIKLKINILNNCFTPSKNELNSKNKILLSPIKMQRELSENRINSKSIDYINNYNYNIIFNIFSEEELDIIKALYENKYEKYNEFIRKVNILEKYQNSKDKAYLITIKKLKMKIDDYIYRNNCAENSIKDKDNKIFFLTKQIKELLKKNKDLNENNKKLIALIRKLNKKYEEEKISKIKLANHLLKYESENKIENDNKINSIKVTDNNNNINNNNDLNKNENISNENINKDIIIGKDDLSNENKIINNENDDSNDKNIIIYKENLNQIPNNQEIIQERKLSLSEDSNNESINNGFKDSEKDLELDSIFSQNILESPHKKKNIEYKIISNETRVDIKGIKKENSEPLFETQPIKTQRKIEISSNIKNDNKRNNNSLLLLNKTTGNLQEKNKKKLTEINLINQNIKKNEIKRVRKNTVIIRDKSKFAITEFLNFEKKRENNKKKNESSKVNILFDN